MRAWIRILDVPGCYECAVWAERKFSLQGSGLIRTIALCAQRRVALLPQAIATARDALLNDWRESATLSRGLHAIYKQALARALATEKREARSVLCHTYQ